MSSIFKFINLMSPRIRKAEVQKDLEASIQELAEFAIPMARDLAEQAKVAPFKSKFFNSFASIIYDHVKFERKSQNAWLDISSALSNVQANAESLLKSVNEMLQEDTLKDGVTARGAHLLRVAGAISFVSRFTTEVTDYVLEQEAVSLGDEDSIAPAQAKYLATNVEKYAKLLADVSIPVKEFEKLFNDLPDVFLSEKTESLVTSMFTLKQLDPFSKMAGMSGWINSPIYIGRMMWETYQAERFHAAKDRKAILELRLIHLQNKQHNENNPRLQKEIEGLEARIRKYEQKIRKVEESLI